MSLQEEALEILNKISRTNKFIYVIFMCLVMSEIVSIIAFVVR